MLLRPPSRTLHLPSVARPESGRGSFRCLPVSWPPCRKALKWVRHSVHRRASRTCGRRHERPPPTSRCFRLPLRRGTVGPPGRSHRNHRRRPLRHSWSLLAGTCDSPPQVDKRNTSLVRLSRTFITAILGSLLPVSLVG